VNGAGPPRGPVRILFLHPMDFLNETIDVRGYDEQISGEPGPGFQYVCRAPSVLILGGPGGPPLSRYSAITKASSTEPMTCPASGGAMIGESISLSIAPICHLVSDG